MKELYDLLKNKNLLNNKYLDFKECYDFFSKKDNLNVSIIFLSCFYNNGNIVINKSLYETLKENTDDILISNILFFLNELNIIRLKDNASNDELVFDILDLTIKENMKVLSDNVNEHTNEIINDNSYIKNNTLAREKIVKLQDELKSKIKDIK